MIVQIKIGNTTYERDDPKEVAALKKCKTEKEAERVLKKRKKRR